MKSIKKELEFIIDKTYENLNKENNYKNFKIEFSKKESTKNEKYKENIMLLTFTINDSFNWMRFF